MWNICFREYDMNGNLTELISCKSKRILTKWKSIQSFLHGCKEGKTREVQFCKNGRQQPSLVSNGEQIKFMKPIVALLPLFDYARSCDVEV